MDARLLKKIRRKAIKKISLTSVWDENNPNTLTGYRVVWSKKNRFTFARYKTSFFEVKRGSKQSEEYKVFSKAERFATEKVKEWEQYFFWSYKREYRWHNPKRDWRRFPGC